jgi:Rod binding domain-containing protein
MPTPVYRFRLSHADQKNLNEMAQVFGSPNTSVFLREMVGAMCSGDPPRVSSFTTKLFTSMGEQLALEFAEKAKKQANQAKKSPVKSKLKGRGAKR